MLSGICVVAAAIIPNWQDRADVILNGLFILTNYLNVPKELCYYSLSIGFICFFNLIETYQLNNTHYIKY